MGFFNTARERVKREYEQFKYNRELDNNPDVVRARLQEARKIQAEQIRVQRQQLKFEREKRELRTLQDRDSFKSKLKVAGGQVKSYLQEVKKKREARELDADDKPKRLNFEMGGAFK